MTNETRSIRTTWKNPILQEPLRILLDNWIWRIWFPCSQECGYDSKFSLQESSKYESTQRCICRSRPSYIRE